MIRVSMEIQNWLCTLLYHEVFHAMLDQAGLGGGGLDEELRCGEFFGTAQLSIRA